MRRARPADTTRVRAPFRLSAIALGALLALAGCGGGDDSNGTASLDAVAPDSTRIATVRVYQNNAWTVPGETPASVGRVLASLEPTWVSSLIRYQAGEAPMADEVSAWETISEAVLAKSPNATFGVELNAVEYRTPAAVQKQMREVRAKLHNDGWFFDFYTPAYRLRPEVVEAAISEAHSNGEWVGGNAFGLAANPPVPPGSDFIAVQDFRFQIDLAAVRRLAQRIPVTFHLGNSPAFADSDGCVFIEGFSTARREAYVRERVEQQRSNDFRFGYPIFFPECERNSDAANPGLFTYNAPRDGSMMSTIEGLMRKYN
jgi:hypothetical protein